MSGPVSIGTGMPASTLLEAFGVWVKDAFGHTAYQVGSSIHGKVWRDVDVRLILPDDEFDKLFPGYKRVHQIDAKWALMCAAISELAKRQTGLPVDFQIQPQTEANAKFRGPRQPLMLFTRFDIERDLASTDEKEGSEQ